jgi:Low affinity iron permease
MHANLPIGPTSATSQSTGDWFARLAVATSRISGRPTTFLLAVAVVLVWAITGPLFGFSDTLAARHQYRHDNRDVSDGLSDPGDAEPRHAGLAIEA